MKNENVRLEENEAVYQVQNRQFIVHRQFSDKKTIPELLVTEITTGLLSNCSLKNSHNSDIMEP